MIFEKLLLQNFVKQACDGLHNGEIQFYLLGEKFLSTDELFDQAESLQNLLVSQATNGNEDNAEYMRLRQTMLSQPSLESVLPRVVRTCRNLSQFWQFIKFEFSTYALRRDYLWREFKPMLDLLEGADRAPSDGERQLSWPVDDNYLGRLVT